MRPQLLLVSRRDEHQLRSFQEVVRRLEAFDPGIRVRVVHDWPYRRKRFLLAVRPTLVVSPRPLERFRPLRGAVFQGAVRDKVWELERLGAAGVLVPRWTVLRGPDDPVPRDFGPYVVLKPNDGGRGALVRIARSGRVSWKPEYAAHQGLVVQEFVYTGRWPRSTRVCLLFGEVLYAWVAEANHARRPLESRYAFAGHPRAGGVSVVASARDCTMTLTDDPEMLALARRAASAFPDVPLLGVDLVRDIETSRCYVLEVNPRGRAWHFTSRPGRSIQATHGFDLTSQFDGLNVAARTLAAETRRHAR
jgi:hypothetical protein